MGFQTVAVRIQLRPWCWRVLSFLKRFGNLHKLLQVHMFTFLLDSKFTHSGHYIKIRTQRSMTATNSQSCSHKLWWLNSLAASVCSLEDLTLLFQQFALWACALISGFWSSTLERYYILAMLRRWEFGLLRRIRALEPNQSRDFWLGTNYQCNGCKDVWLASVDVRQYLLTLKDHVKFLTKTHIVYLSRANLQLHAVLGHNIETVKITFARIITLHSVSESRSDLWEEPNSILLYTML